MANTRGFEVVIEAGPSVLTKALRGAWKSAECGDVTGDGRIPQFLPIPSGLGVGGFTIAGGQIEIPQDQLDAELRPAIDGTRLSVGLLIQATLVSPPVPTAELLDLTATATVDAPVGVLPGTKNVGIQLGALPRNAVNVTVTSGEPLASKVDILLAEYFHLAYENGGPNGPNDPSLPTVPHEVDESNRTLSFGVGSYTVDSHMEIYDDPSDPLHHVLVSRPTPTNVLISIPVYLRLFNIRRSGLAPILADPMGIETRLEVTAALESPAGQYTIRFDTATAAAGQVTPAPGIEGTNYTTNNGRLFNQLDGALRAQLAQEGTTLVRAFGARTVAVPTANQIATVVGDHLHADLVARGSLGLWTPEAGAEVFQARDVATRVFNDVLAIALNAGPGADIGALENLVPTAMEFAIALDEAVVQRSIDEARVGNGWADSDLPRRVDEDGTKADVRELDVFLVDGAIRMEGELTVVDAILGSIDVDADFRADVGLHWNPDGQLNADGVQQMDNHVIGDPEVDPEESVAFWIIAIILAIITWGAGSIFIAIVIIVAAAVVAAVASSIGSSMAVDPVTGAVRGITGWPPELARIGRVEAVFHDPILISAEGLVMAGTMNVLSSCEQTTVLSARSGGPYTGVAQQLLTLAAGNTDVNAQYTWAPGDASPIVGTASLPHVYSASGVYLAEHGLRITQPGGTGSRHLALVYVANVAPTVDAGPDIEVDEGEVVLLTGTFTDVEYADLHEATWNFGDRQPTEAGDVVERNVPPRAEGTASVRHAWCDDGVYEVTLRVRDQNGGMATDTRTVTVRNVPPVVDAGPDVFAYPCTVLTMTASFTDPGWCDTHTARWDFGDCSTPIPAVIAETHEPPAGTGTAVASHIYRTCGTFLARCTVVDDDGGEGADTVVVRVTDVNNSDFEGGFARRTVGEVANGWEPYVAQPSRASGHHGGSPFVVRDGRRAQEVGVEPGQRAGICQRVGANPGWVYQVTAEYDVDERGVATARLGVDPSGGSDPDAPSVVWSSSPARDRWTPLTVRVTADARAITVFLDATNPRARRDGKDATEPVWFDHVELLAIQPACPPAEETRSPKEECLELGGREPDSEVPAEWEESGFSIRTLDGGPRRVVQLPDPPGRTALVVGAGLAVGLPGEASAVRIMLVNAGGGPVRVIAMDAAGQGRDGYEVPSGTDAQPVTVTLRGPGVAGVLIDGEGAEGLLVRLCADREPTSPAPSSPPRSSLRTTPSGVRRRAHRP